MSTTKDTNAIDEKKKDTKKTNIDFKDFLINFFKSVLFTIIISIFIFGSIGLYTTKVAQSNILPEIGRAHV